MTKLKVGSVQDEKPVRLSVALPAALHRDLVAYAEILSRESGKPIEASKLIAPMLEKFIASDREFAKARGKKETKGGVTRELPSPRAEVASPASIYENP
jgi:hypothetical protein